jgi:predicted nucleotidyltransferase
MGVRLVDGRRWMCRTKLEVKMELGKSCKGMEESHGTLARRSELGQRKNFGCRSRRKTKHY